MSFAALALTLLLVAPGAWASCTPTVSAVVLASDHVQITAGVSGPCGGSAVSLYIDDHYIGQGSSDNPSFSGLFNLSNCFQAGQHHVVIYGYCNTTEAPNCNEPSNVSHNVSTDFTIPETTIAIDSAELDDNNQLHLVASYVIPTDHQTRSVTFYKNGVQITGTVVSSQSGTEAIDYDLSCSPPDTTYQIGASALGCDYDYAEVPVTVHYKPKALLNVRPYGSDYKAVIDYELRGTTDANRRSLSLKRLPLNKSFSSLVTLEDFYGLDSTGSKERVVTPTDEEQILYALGAVCDHYVDSVAHVPSCCPSVGDPVSLQKGNMRYSDSEPLPSAGFGPLRRTYDSNNAETGLFGYGWSSLLDGWVRFYTTVGSAGVAVIGTEENDRVVFSNVTGAWRQIWPVQDNVRSTFTYSSGVAVWTDLAAKKVWTFGTGGALTSVRSLIDGRQWTITRDGSGYPTLVSDSWGSVVWTVSVDATSHLVTSVGVQGRTDLTWTYQYGTGNDLASVLAPDSATWRTYSYTSHRLTDAHDPLGNLIESHAYDSSGAATSSIGPSGEIPTVVTGASGRTSDEWAATVTWQSGRVSTYYSRPIGGTRRIVEMHNACTGCDGETAVYVYDENGNVVRQQDGRGYVETSTYDAQNRLTLVSRYLRPSSCNPATSSTSCVLTTDDLATATLSTTSATVNEQRVYGDTSWPDRPTQIMTDSIYGGGAFGRVETFTYDATTGDVLVHTTTGKSGSPAASETHTVTTALYDGTETAAFDVCGGSCAFTTAMQSLPQPAGRRKSVDGARTDVTDVTQWVYYPNDSSVAGAFRGRLAATKMANGLITRYEDYDVFGHARRVIDPNGVATETTYDALGRLLTSTVKAVSGCDTDSDPLCGTDVTSSRTYSAGGGPLATETRPLGGVRTYTYDARGRVATVTRTVSSTLSERMEYDYDAASGKKSAERFRDNRTGSWVTRRSESYAYDQQDRLATVTHPDSTTITYTYDSAGRALAVKDENHSTANTHYAYDPARRLQTVTQTLTGVTGNAISTGYAYDVHGNLTGVTDPNGNVTSYVYDDFGRMLSQTSPVTGTTTYSYDLAGNMVSTTSANSRTTTRTYDELGRVTEADSTGGSATETVTWGYDSPDQHFGLGRLTLMSDPSGDTAYDYDRQGRVMREGLPDGGLGTVAAPTTYAYDADGNLADLGYPSGTHVQYTSDLAGRPLTVTREGTTTVVSNVEYLPFGPLTKIEFGNGTTRQSTYDSRYRMTSNKLLTAAGTLADYEYTSDDGGNITAIADAVDATYSRTFGYDDLNRLTSANTGTALWGTGAYTYDRMGNMQSYALGSSRTGSFTYSGTTSKVATATENSVTSSVTYDDAGNELTGGSTSSTYSSRNLLEAGGYTYTYDGRGVRTTATGGIILSGPPPHTAAVFSFYYSASLHLLATSSNHALGSPFTGEFLWMGDLPVGDYDVGASSFRYTFTDHLGTPIIQTDDTGSIAWQVEYEPYGRIYAQRSGGTLFQPLRFPGQEDHDGADYYNVFRWYRSGWGRYTQSDPLGVALETNAYFYVSDNPAIGIDPLGEATINVAKIGEQTYNTLAAYQSANPCGVTGTSYSCTERPTQRLSCRCKCIGANVFVMDVAVDIQLKYHLAGGPAGAQNPPPFYWNGYRRHENLHFQDLITEVTKHANSLEANRYQTMDDCNIGCGTAIGGFNQWMNQWAIDSNRRLH